MIDILPPPKTNSREAAGLGGNLAPATSALGTLPGSSPGEQLPRTIRREIRDDQVCVLTFDRPGSAANIFDHRTLAELREEIELIAGNSHIKGVILTSAKRSIFIAGADLRLMEQGASSGDIRDFVELGQNVMNRLAALPIPTVAAIHGAAVGGGCELGLACDYRVASSDRQTKIGLPEVQLGLLPAWGGSTRLPRLVGLPRALDIILAGKTLAARQALKCGLVDELAPAEYLVTVAARLIHRGKPHRSARRVINNRLVAACIAARLRPRLVRKTRGHYPAVLKALEVVTRGISKSVSESLALERDQIIGLVQTDACRNLIRLFFLQERAKKLVLTGTAPDTGSKQVSRAAVIGAGVMGAGIAQWLTSRQLPVILRDISTEQIARGMGAIANLYKDGARRHLFSATEVRAGMDRISPAVGDVPLRHVDIVIEAALEELESKKRIFRQLDDLAGDETVLATNTSALPVSELAASTRHPERVLGLHFFNPVHRMQLVEIVAARQTSPKVLQRALRFVQQIGKLPVIVKDSPGFLVNRILMPYLVEAGSLFDAGASVTDLDEAMLQFGMPMGPMLLLDEVGIDVARHVARTLALCYRDRMSVPDILAKMIKAGLTGRKSGRGFYVHRKGQSAQANPQVVNFANSRRAASLSREDLQQRMVLLIINEAARCLEEQIVCEPEEIDFSMVMGTGFAPFRGGPLRHADALGAKAVVDAMDRLVQSGASHFEPCALLRSMAAAGKTFHNHK
jgi:3-hydroxyacyl-CoA dehydrogenase/enoyl-CoA hydratase/3-hydroxybutyryl-CoA epimerase